jgi:hypothetical protein
MDEDYPRCGAPTVSGKPCRTRVSTYRPTRCSIHREQSDPPLGRDHLVAIRLALHEAIMRRMYARESHQDLLEIQRMLPSPKDLTA